MLEAMCMMARGRLYDTQDCREEFTIWTIWMNQRLRDGHAIIGI